MTKQKRYWFALGTLSAINFFALRRKHITEEQKIAVGNIEDGGKRKR